MSSLILSATLQINALDVKQEKVLKTIAPEPLYIDAEDNLEIHYLDKNSISTGQGPDIIITGLGSCWGYNYNNDYDALYVKFYIMNSGDQFDNNDQIIECYLSFFADDETEPFAYIILTPWFDPTIWHEWEALGFNFHFPKNYLTERPDTITLIVDYTNVIPESNEENNAEISYVVSAISSSGYVYDEDDDGNLIPISDCLVHTSVGPPINMMGNTFCYSKSDGYYNVIIFPAEPFDQPHSYHLLAQVSHNEKWQIKNPSGLMPGDSISIDFIFEGRSPTKPLRPVGPMIVNAGKCYNFSSIALDMDGDEIYYLFDWGDGTSSYWLGPYQSGETVVASHTWNNEKLRFYELRVLAKDEHGTLSQFSETTYITFFNISSIESIPQSQPSIQQLNLKLNQFIQMMVKATVR